MPEDDAAMGGGFSATITSGGGLGGMFGRSRTHSVAGAFTFDTGADKAAGEVANLNTQLAAFKSAMQDLSSSQYTLKSGLTGMLDSISTSAKRATDALRSVSGAMGGVSGGGGGGGAASFTAPQIPTAGGTGMGAGESLASNLLPNQGGGGVLESATAMAANLAMLPMRFMRERITSNRNVALLGSQMLAPLSRIRAPGAPRGEADLFGQMYGGTGALYGGPGMLGTAEDQIAAIQMGTNIGAYMGAGPQARRSAGYFRGIGEIQNIMPGVSSAQAGGMIAQQMQAVGGAQEAAMLTGGAFAMVGPGGRQKTPREWAESILKWMEGQRPGSKRGQPFNYGELIAQNFPGSNFNAWFRATGVTADMQAVFWNYALSKVSATGTTGGGPFKVSGADTLAYERQQAVTAATQPEFRLAEGMIGQYINREQVNEFANRAIGTASSNAIVAATTSGPLQFLQFLPDFIEDLFFNFINRGGPLTQLIGGGLFTAGAIGGLQGTAAEGLAGATGTLGDIGDIGDAGWGNFGGTGLGTLNPDLQKKLGAMMKANPRLSITSGARDSGMQQRLRNQGYSKVSGRPSAHTRGMAADLGPRSEYDWINKNAKKFGLRAGGTMGEPWHVDLGDPVPGPTPEAPATGGAAGATGGGGGVLDLLGMGGSDPMSLVQMLMGNISDLFGGLFGSGGIGALGKGLGAITTALLGPFASAAGGGMGRFAPSAIQQLNLPTTFELSGGYTSFAGFLSGATGGAGGAPGAGGAGAAAAGGAADAGKQLSGTAVAQYAHAAGFRGADLITMTAIAKAESGYNAGAHNPNASTGDNSYGLWQINMLGSMGPDRLRKYGLSSNDELLNPAVNATVAYDFFQGQGFRPWSTWKRGEHSEHMADAQAAVSSAGLGDIMERSYLELAPTRGESRPMVFNNNFQISANGGNGAIDVRRLVVQIADQLEPEMKRRAARVA